MSYNLRIVNKERIEINHILGDEYTIISKTKNKKRFTETIKLHCGNKVPDNIHSIVISSLGTVFLLEKDCQYYIMTENGSTFSNLTRR